MVFLGHGFSPSYEYLGIDNTILSKVLWLFSTGGTGVSIFFVLSGFLITYQLLVEYETNKKVSLKDFYIRRVLRIWPLYFLVVFLSFFAYPFIKDAMGINNPLGTNVYYHLVFLSNFDCMNMAKNCAGSGAMSQSINWSVSIEEQFYVFWPLIFVLLRKKYWLMTIISVILVSIGFRLIHRNDDKVLYFHTLSVLLDLGIGGLFAILIKTRTRIRSFFEHCGTLSHLTLFAFSLALLYFKSHVESNPYGLALGRILISSSFAMIICAQSFTKQASILNLGNLSFASKWGKYTYGIYLLHPIALTIVDVGFRLLHIPKNNFWSLFILAIIALILTLVISKLSYVYFETPFLRLKKRFETVKTRVEDDDLGTPTDPMAVEVILDKSVST